MFEVLHRIIRQLLSLDGIVDFYNVYVWTLIISSPIIRIMVICKVRLRPYFILIFIYFQFFFICKWSFFRLFLITNYFFVFWIFNDLFHFLLIWNQSLFLFFDFFVYPVNDGFFVPIIDIKFLENITYNAWTAVSVSWIWSVNNGAVRRHLSN